MTVAHLGVGVFILGVTLTGAYNVEKDMRMDRALRRSSPATPSPSRA